MNVIARPGTRCPMEGKPRTHITDQTAITVPDTAYYRRLVADGSLVPAEARRPRKEKK